MNVKIFDIKIGDKILVKPWKRNEFTTLYKSEPFTAIEKKGNIKVMLQNLGYQRFWVEKCFVFQRLVL